MALVHSHRPPERDALATTDELGQSLNVLRWNPRGIFNRLWREVLDEGLEKSSKPLVWASTNEWSTQSSRNST